MQGDHGEQGLGDDLVNVLAARDAGEHCGGGQGEQADNRDLTQGIWPIEAWTRPAKRPVTGPCIRDGRIRLKSRACSPPNMPHISRKAISTDAIQPAGSCQGDRTLSSSDDRKARAIVATSSQWKRRTPKSQVFMGLIAEVGVADMGISVPAEI